MAKGGMVRKGVPSQLHRPTYAEVDLAALAHNFKSIRKQLNPKVKVLAVIKSNAYGHELNAVAKRFDQIGVDYFGLVRLEEALELRTSGITTPILLMGGLLADGFEDAISHDITIGVIDFSMLQALDRLAKKLAKTVAVQVKVDTGMHRLGIPWTDFIEKISFIKDCHHLKLTGLYSHLANADNLSDNYAQTQLQRFNQAFEAIHKLIPQATIIRHIANSDGIFRGPEWHLDMVRPGIALYGYCRRAGENLMPVLSLKSRIIQIKELATGESVGYDRYFRTNRNSRIAIAPLGYADGFSRAYSGTRVIANGCHAHVVGRISMDMLMIDVTEVPQVKVGDEITFIGHSQKLEASAYELAKISNTTHYQVLTSIQSRVPRLLVDSGNHSGNRGSR